MKRTVPAVPRKGFGSAVCDSKIIYQSLCTQTADMNPFRGTHCIFKKNLKGVPAVSDANPSDASAGQKVPKQAQQGNK